MPDMQKPIAFMRSQFFSIPPYPTKKYTGQTIIVTGSNVGLGLEASRHFVRLDAAKVVLAVRTIGKGEAAKRSIEESTGRTGVVEVWQLDLSHYESVKDFAERAQGLERLDILVENAGIVTFNFSMAEDNESAITTNVVSPILHSLLLLPKLRATGAKYNTLPRYVNSSRDLPHVAGHLPATKTSSILFVAPKVSSVSRSCFERERLTQYAH